MVVSQSEEWGGGLGEGRVSLLEDTEAELSGSSSLSGSFTTLRSVLGSCEAHWNSANSPSLSPNISCLPPEQSLEAKGKKRSVASCATFGCKFIKISSLTPCTVLTTTPLHLHCPLRF